ncbi:MAG TPA: protein kinase [Candidatus Sulfotelmatobacter sp.]|nr:protein kinase [Candidatus Sulfotelmatobacter sp.]
MARWFPSVIGRKLGHYCILEKIGAGGMGEVYQAHDEQLNRIVALKILLPKDFTDEKARLRLLREAQAAARLNHPHICTIHEVGQADGIPYIAMEYVEGRPLSVLIAEKRLSHELALRYGVQLADALEHAHARGVIHRDLKSANVMVTPEARVKVLDFGLAKWQDEAGMEDVTRSEATLTQPGAVLGTLCYMAPEQLRGEPADARSDIWALGTVLYEMAAGKRPFQGHTGYEVCSAILSRQPEPLQTDVPAPLWTVIERCLQKKPSERYQHANDVRLALEAIPSTGTAAQLSPQPKILMRKRTASHRRIRALAVLPLSNLSRDSEQEYFADGMTEALIADLAKIQALRIISRTSVMRYKTTAKSLPEIAAELNVDAVVEGSVLRVGQRVRITAQLIHAATDTHLWAESYERDLQDVLCLQSEVARAIAREIRVAVTPEEKQRLASAPRVNPEAHEAYLKGRFHWHKLSPEHLETALGYFQLALEKEPNYALAYVGIAYVWFSRADTGVIPPLEAIEKVKAAALRAVELDDRLAEVHELLAAVTYVCDWDWPGAEKEFRIAIRLNPNSAETRFFYAHFLAVTGRLQEWKPEIERALELDPLNFFTQCFFGWQLVYLRRHDEAIEQLQKVLRTEPNFPAAHQGLWGAFYQKRRYEEALLEAKNFFNLLGDHEIAEALECGHAGAGYSEVMRRAAQILATRAEQTYIPALRIARLYAHAGYKDCALQWLERACEQHEPPLVHLGVGWDWDSLRDEPRFQDLLRRINYPQ